MRNLILLLAFLFSSIHCTKNANLVSTKNESHPRQAKNVIFLIGDGMGLGQITLGMYANGNKTALEQFGVLGLHKSHASNMLITDSAAGATAFACGVKTFNGAIGVDADTLPARTLLEEAEEKGLVTGLVATCSITHATPASFIAHNEYRKNYEAIASDFLSTEVDFFIGGGYSYFNRRVSDERNLIEELVAKGYKVDNYFDTSLEESIVDYEKNYAFFTADKEPLAVSQGRDYLPASFERALDFLPKHDANDKGFFLMLEGSQIDWGGHANNQEYIISEFIEFDKVIERALQFAKEDGNTLVVVTADHETGGLAIQKESRMDSLVTAFTSDYHTGTMIPVFAYGPGSELFAGIYENTAIYDKIRAAYMWE